MEPTYTKPLFIIGYPRSGTTLLRAVLGAHSQIHLVHEPELIRGLRTAGFTITDHLKRGNYAQLIEAISETKMCRRHLSTLPPEVLSAFVECPRDLSFREIYEFLLPVPEGVAVWGEKSIGNILYIRELRELYPSALFVYIVRDPRAALLSHYRKRFAHSANCQPVFGSKELKFFAHGAMRWLNWQNIVEDALRSLGQNVLIQVKYEDLVAEPLVELRRICDALGVDVEQGMLDANRRKADPVIAPGTVYGAYAHTRLAEPIDSTRATTSKVLPGWSCYIIQRYTKLALAELGYALDQPRVGIYEKLKIRAELSISEKGLRARLRKETENRQKTGNSLGQDQSQVKTTSWVGSAC